MPYKRLITIGLAALTVLAMSASASQARVSKRFFGVLSLSAPSAQQFRTLSGGGVGTYHVNLSLQRISPQPGVYNWTYYDNLFANAARAGLKVFPTVIVTPHYVAANGAPPRTNHARQVYSAVLGQAVHRYGPHGTFWQAHPGLPALPITQWQVWNEPNLRYFWQGRPNARSYVSLLKLSRTVIRRQDRHAQIVLAGMPISSRSGIPERKFLDSIYRVPRARYLFEVVATHPYMTRPRYLPSALGELRAVMSRHGDRRKGLIVDELGWASAAARSPFTKGGQQAGTIRYAVNKILALRRRDNIVGFHYYTFADGSANRHAGWIERSGLFDFYGHPKSSWWAFRNAVRAGER